MSKFLKLSYASLLLIGWISGGTAVAQDRDIQAPGPRVVEEAPVALKLSELVLQLASSWDSTPTPEGWATAMKLMSESDARDRIRKALERRQPFPRAQLTQLLAHQELVVRLGALELLESAAGQDMGFNPWTPGAPNEEALARWQAWAKGAEAVTLADPKLTDERAQSLFQDILSPQRDREERALVSLERYGLEGIIQTQRFLESHPELESGARARLKAAQYRLVIASSSHDEAPLLAKQLVMGNRDQQLTALGRLKKIGEPMLPIVQEFVGHRDALIRETAVDVFLTLGKQPALELIRGALQREKDLNVLQAAIRQLSDLPCDASLALLLVWAHHPEEDIVVDAVNSLSKIGFTAASARAYSSSRKKSAEGVTSNDANVGPALLNKLLKDSRWRVRTAALECVTKLKLRACTEATRALLADEDEFVRAAAIKACAALQDTTGLGQLETIFTNDPRMSGPVISAWISNDRSISPKVLETLMKRDAEAVLPLFSEIGSSSNAIPLLRELTKHGDRDVALSAWRALAQHHARELSGELSDAIVKGAPEVRKMVLQNLYIYSSDRDELQKYWQNLAGAVENVQVIGTKERGTSLDPLYKGFLEPLEAARPKKDSVTAVPLNPTDESQWPPMVGADTKKVSPLAPAILSVLNKPTDEEEAIKAATLLAKLGGNQRAATLLVNKFTTLSVPQRARIADEIPGSPHPVYWPLLKTALNDPEEAVRTQAISSAFYDEESVGLVRLALDLALEKDSKLKAGEFMGYSFDSVLRDPRSRGMMMGWAEQVLAKEGVKDEFRILALKIVVSLNGVPPEAILQKGLESTNPWMRRIALWATAKQSRKTLEQVAPKLINDPAPTVRAALASLLGGFYGIWVHHFNDSAADMVKEDSGKVIVPSQEDLSQLRTLQNDASKEVQFAATYALLVVGEPVDLPKLIALARQQPESADAPVKMAMYLGEFYRALPSGANGIMNIADLSELDESVVRSVEEQFRSANKAQFSFATLTKATEPVVKTSPAETSVAPPPVAPQEPFSVVYFFSPGCAECSRVSEWLDKLEKKFPRLIVERRNIRESDSLVLNQALCLRAGVPARSQNLTPAIFSQVGFLVKESLDQERLENLLRKASFAQPDPNWAVVDAADVRKAQTEVENRFSSFGPGVVITGGLLDGINPCAFATIIFLLSYLKIAKRSPREILAVGGAFILAVFLTYFLIGLVLNEAIGWLSHLDFARKVMNTIFAIFALIIAVLSFRDALRAKQGRLSDMSLQMPGFLKDRVRQVVRTGARSSRFVIAAFITGVVITFLELACTGQVYAPIVYAIRQGSSSAVGYLLLYNVAFISPLVIIFLFAYSGMKSDRLIEFQSKYTALIKFAMGLLFLILGLFLLLKI